MKVLLLILVFICCALASKSIQEKWKDFKTKYKKEFKKRVYDLQRFKNYRQKLEYIENHNNQSDKTYEMAENFFTDMDLNDIQKLHMGFKLGKDENKKSSNVAQSSTQPKVSGNISDLRDWRKKGVISRVKNQEACGASWAFSSVGALEAHYYLKNNDGIDLSAQHLVNCVPSGCAGGWMNTAFDYIKSYSIKSDKMYPYIGKVNECDSSNVSIVQCNGYEQIRKGDEQHMQEVVDKKGPVSVAIEVNQNFVSYSKGVYVDSSCNASVNHAVLVVGFGTEKGQDYWLVKNSWGRGWGEGGYIKMARNKKNQCAIASYGSYPLV